MRHNKNSSMGSRLDLFLVWSHGVDYIDEILSMLRARKEFELLLLKKFIPDNLKDFLDAVYNTDTVPIQHLMAKNAHLYQLKTKTLFLLLVRNNDPQEQMMGEGEYAHIQSMSVNGFKWEVRERFNPRKKDGTRSELHMIHGTDYETQVHAIWPLFGLMPIAHYARKSASYPDWPWYLDIPAEFDIVDVAIRDLWVLLSGVPSLEVPLEESFQYLYVNGDKQPYIDYWQEHRGVKLLTDGTPEKFDEMIANFRYPFSPMAYIIIRKDGRILDGTHRAAILLYSGAEKIRAIRIQKQDEY